MPLNPWIDEEERKRELGLLPPAPAVDAAKLPVLPAPAPAAQPAVAPSVSLDEFFAPSPAEKPSVGENLGLILSKIAAGIGDAGARSFGGQNTNFLGGITEMEKAKGTEKREEREQKRKDIAAWIEARKNQKEGLEKQLDAMQKMGKDKAELENKLRDEYIGLTKDYRTIRDSHQRLVASAANPSPAGDLAMLFNYMKILDPGSVVRESEFEAAATAGSYGQRMQAAVNQAMKGEKLSDSMRADFLDRSNKLMESQTRIYDNTKGQYIGLAKRYGVSPENVGFEMEAQAPVAIAPPQYEQDVLDYAKKHGITHEEAQKIKNERTGGK